MMGSINIQLLFAIASSFAIVYVTIPVLKFVAFDLNLYDQPDVERKIHKKYIPTLGGIAIFLGFFISFSYSGYAGGFEGYPYFTAAITILFFTGLKDDIIGLSPVKKMVGQVMAASLLIFGCDLVIDNLYGVFGFELIPAYVSIPLTLFTIVVVINACNLIDGIDGLAAGIGTLSTLAFAAIFYLSGEVTMAAMSLILGAALLGFLKYNFSPATIFMGDTGSLLIGFLLSTLGISFLSLGELGEFRSIFGNSSPTLLIAILAVPLYDTITVFFKRISRGESPFKPGKEHVHHNFLEMGFSHRVTSITLYSINILIIFIAISSSKLGVNLSLAITLFSCFLFLPNRGHKRGILMKIGIDTDQMLTKDEPIDDIKRKSEVEAKRHNQSSVSQSSNDKSQEMVM